MVKKILRAVPSKFLQIASTIEQFGNMESMIVEEVFGGLRAHEERMKGQTEDSGNQLLLTQEEWMKRSNKGGGTGNQSHKSRGANTFRGRGRGFARGGGAGRGHHSRSDTNKSNTPSRSHIKCFNCNVYGHYAAECKKPNREKDREKSQTPEANLTKTHDDDPILLFTECGEKEDKVVLLSEEGVIPSLGDNGNEAVKLDIWYLNNGASNHMTGRRSKFRELNENITR